MRHRQFKAYNKQYKSRLKTVFWGCTFRSFVIITNNNLTHNRYKNRLVQRSNTAENWPRNNTDVSSLENRDRITLIGLQCNTANHLT